MSTKKFIRKLLSMMMAVAMLMSVMSVSAFAAEIQTSESEVQSVEDTAVTPRMSTYSRGRWYLGHFTFTDNNRGNAFILNGSKVRVCVAFKKASTDKQSSNIDLDLELHRISYSGGNEYYHLRWGDRFMSSKDTPDSDGYYYFVGDWYELGTETGKPFCLYYEALTALGQSSNGNARSADVHVWLDVE